MYKDTQIESESSIKVSVIVPIYNVDKYLDKCLYQLTVQNLDGIEVIMVDDGSTDLSAEIAASYEKKYSNFYLIRQPNRGLSAARNAGLDKATGKYVYFCDSDDYIVDNALRELYLKSEENALDMIRFLGYHFQDGEENNLRETIFFYNKTYGGVREGADLFNEMTMNGDNIPSIPLAFIRRNIVEENHIHFLEGIINEDNLFHFYMMQCCTRVLIWDKRLYCYRLREGSITHGKNYYKSFVGLATTAVYVERYLKENKEKYSKGIIKYLFMQSMDCKAMMEKLPTDEWKENLSQNKRIVDQLSGVMLKHLFWGKIYLVLFWLRLYLHLLF